jgi:hypothetical protein
MVLTRKKNNYRAKGVDLTFFDTLFRGVWVRMVSVLGVSSVQGILREALAEAVTHYKVLEHIRVREGGVLLKGLEAVLQADGVATEKEVEKALWGFLELVTQKVGVLSGDMVSRKIITYVEQKEQGKAFGQMLHRTGLEF